MNLYHLEACERALAAYHAARIALQVAYEQLRSEAGHLRPTIQHRTMPRRAKALIAECRERVDDE